MIDRGLLASLAAVIAVLMVVDWRRRRRQTGEDRILDFATTGILLGLVAARLVAVIVDDPASLRRPADLLLLRGGMEFWPGVMVGTVAVWVVTRRSREDPTKRLAVLAPYGLLAYATYAVTCALRDGCFGPESPVGLAPGGVGSRQMPIGILEGLAVAALAWAIWRWGARIQPAAILAICAGGLASLRLLASLFLPKVTVGLSRPQLESLLVLFIALVYGATLISARAVPSRTMEAQ